MKLDQSGFTIIELVIATAVFAVLLVITTTTIIGVSQTYIKGSVEGETQQTARSVMNDISQAIQFNLIGTANVNVLATHSSTDEYYFCLGDDVYLYQLDRELVSSPANSQQASWALVRYENPTPTCPTSSTLPSSPPTGSVELLSEHERLGQLYIAEDCADGTQPNSSGQCDNSIKPNGNTYTIYLEVAYGDNALLNDVGTLSNDGTITTNANYINGNDNGLSGTTATTTAPASAQYVYQCQSGPDNSFCATSVLTTTVVQSITN